MNAEPIERIYVAQVDVPTGFYAPPRYRRTIPEPEVFGIIRGYWEVRLEPDHLSTPRPTGLTVTLQLLAQDIEDAEDKAITAAMKLSELLAAYRSSPIGRPILRRLAAVGPGGGIIEQNEYFYGDEVDELPRIPLEPDGFDGILHRYSALDAKTSFRVGLGIRWYGVALGEFDTIDAYLAVWIGLESIGVPLNERYHPEGPRMSCAICGNLAGQDRDRKDAGILHTIRITAPELLSGRTLDDLKDIRNNIAHGLTDPETLRAKADELLPDLQLVLGVGIISALTPKDAPPGSGRIALPRDYQFHPESRATFRSDSELVNHQAYFGEWIPVTREFVGEKSRCEPDGNYIWGADKVTVEGRTNHPGPPSRVEREFVRFERRGHEFILPDDAGQPVPPVIPWRRRPLTAAWRRFMLAKPSNLQ